MQRSAFVQHRRCAAALLLTFGVVSDVARPKAMPLQCWRPDL
jgi:hypothetical protein